MSLHCQNCGCKSCRCISPEQERKNELEESERKGFASGVNVATDDIVTIAISQLMRDDQKALLDDLVRKWHEKTL